MSTIVFRGIRFDETSGQAVGGNVCKMDSHEQLIARVREESRFQDLMMVYGIRKNDETSIGKLKDKYYEKLIKNFIGSLSNIRSGDREHLATHIWGVVILGIRDDGYNDLYSIATHIRNVRRYEVTKYLRGEIRFPIFKATVTDDDGSERPYILPDVKGKDSAAVFIAKQLVNDGLEYLRLVFSCGGYPHMQLSWVHARQTFGVKGKDGEIRGKPAKVHRKYGRKSSLKKMADGFFDIFSADLGPDHQAISDIKHAMTPMLERFDCTVEHLIKHSDLDDQLSNILRDEVGSTLLSDYYGKREPNRTIGSWCTIVDKKLDSVLGVEIKFTEDGPDLDDTARAADSFLLTVGSSKCHLRHVCNRVEYCLPDNQPDEK